MTPARDGEAKQWPNLFLVGAARSGTTSFYRYLGQHPEIYMSPVKEPGFFSNTPTRRRWHEKVTDQSQYLALFHAARSEKLLGEATVQYLWAPDAAARIHARSPDAKIIIILRDPVERAYSHYLLEVRDGVEHRPFAKVLREPSPHVIASHVDVGLYCDQVRRYVDLFGANVLVLFFEEVFADVGGALHRTFTFLGVDPAVMRHVLVEPQEGFARPRGALGEAVVRAATSMRSKLGRSLLPGPVRPLARRLVLTKGKRPPMDPAARAYLTALYADQRPCLRRLLGIDPPWPTLRSRAGRSP